MGMLKVEQGQIITGKIEGVGSKGDPYMKVAGFIVFIRGYSTGEKGETVDVQITDVKERCAFGKKV